MEIVYKKPVLEQIREAIAEAKRDGRSIEKVLLTPDEHAELRHTEPEDECWCRGGDRRRVYGVPFEIV